eukprot:scaffold75605_cov32-Prasinocladus_malaysianus.AAC.1
MAKVDLSVLSPPARRGHTSGKTNETNPRNTIDRISHNQKMLISAAPSREPAREHSGQSTRQEFPTL